MLQRKLITPRPSFSKKLKETNNLAYIFNSKFLEMNRCAVQLRKLEMREQGSSSEMVGDHDFKHFLPAAKPRRSMNDKPPPPPSNNESLVAFRGQRSMVT